MIQLNKDRCLICNKKGTIPYHKNLDLTDDRKVNIAFLCKTCKIILHKFLLKKVPNGVKHRVPEYLIVKKNVWAKSQIRAHKLYVEEK